MPTYIQYSGKRHKIREAEKRAAAGQKSSQTKRVHRDEPGGRNVSGSSAGSRRDDTPMYDAGYSADSDWEDMEDQFGAMTSIPTPFLWFPCSMTELSSSR